MDVVSYLVQAYNFLLSLVGVILEAVLGPLGWLALALVLAALVVALLVVRRRAS
jgi:hypothetical protein